MGAPRMNEREIPIQTRDPFKYTAQSYFDAGWLPMPLPPKRKEEPPTGFTGWTPKKRVTADQVKKWISSSKKGSNVCARTGSNYIGIDVDAYKAAGDATYKQIIKEIGELPETWTSSARADGKSGIRHYRLPDGYEGMKWPGTVGEAIQFIHTGHRYPVLPPSRHPEDADDGSAQFYLWYEPGVAPNGQDWSPDFPGIGELTELTVEVIEYFTKGQFAKHLPEKKFKSVGERKAAITAWEAEHDGEPCAEMLRVVEQIEEEISTAGAHDTSRDAIWRMGNLAMEGHAGFVAAASRVFDAFMAEIGRDDREGTKRSPAMAEEEWARQYDQAVKRILQKEDDGLYIGFGDCSCEALDAEGRPRIQLDVSNFSITKALDACYAAVRPSGATAGYGIYQTGGELRELTEDAGLRDVTVNSLRSFVAARVDWGTWAGGDVPKWVPKMAPRDFLGSMMEDSTIRRALPELRGLRHTPFWTMVEGKPELVHTNGYHEGAKTFLQMDPELEESVAKLDHSPPASWVESAKKNIADIFKDFPFLTAADRATAYAALILPFARDLVVGPTPIHLIDAPTAGTGKGLLIEAISKVFCGALDESAGFYRLGVEDDHNRNVELEKAVTSAMRGMADVLLLDNINKKLDSGKLASAVTSYPSLQVRLLGQSRMVQVPNRALWAITANNLTVSDELRRRVVYCRLDAKLQHPERRAGLPDLLGLIEERRPALVWSVLTLIANWVAQGMHPGTERMGSFENWTRVIGGILAANGVRGLLGNREAFEKRASDETGTLDALIDEWVDMLGVGTLVSAADIAALAGSNEIVPEDVRARDRKLGVILSAADGKVFGEYRVEKSMPHNKARYRLVSKTGEVAKPKRRVRSRG